jgi:hypothetical protein
MSRLFSHVAAKFGRSPEDLATEGLHFLLSHHVAADAFVDLLNRMCGTDLPGTMNFRTQEGTEDGEGQPDMKGTAGDGSVPLLVESKFWAGLTRNQPDGYLRALESVPGAVLLFLVPDIRQRYLWSKVLDRIDDPNAQSGGRDRCVHLTNRTSVTMCSWTEVLDTIEAALRREEKSEFLGDLAQLRALCDAYSDSGFTPFRDDELGPGVGKRINQLHRILPNLRSELGDAWAEPGSLAAGQYRNVFKTKVHGLNAAIGIEYNWWANRGTSPLWLRIKARSADRRTRLMQALMPDIKAFRDGDSFPTDTLVPLILKTGAEFDDVMDDLANQLHTIADRLQPALKQDR